MAFAGTPFQTKLLFGFLVTTLFALIVISGASFYSAREQLRMVTFERLTAARETKKAEIEKIFREFTAQCLTISESSMTFSAMDTLRTGFSAMDVSDAEFEECKKELTAFYESEFLPKINETVTTKKSVGEFFPQDRKTIIFQAKYIARNPNLLISKREYSSTGDNSEYDKAHILYHAIYTKYATRFGFSDIYFIDVDTGYVLFNIGKSVDYATNLLTGPFKDTQLAETFRECQKTSDENYVQITDFGFYEPLYGTPTAFIGTPIFREGKKMGVLVFQLPVNTINTIMTYDKRWIDAGLGTTGEVYLRGNDKLMRSLSRFFIEDRTSYLNKLQDLKVDRETIDKIKIYNTTILLQHVGDALEKISDSSPAGTLIDKDYLGVNTLYEYAPLTIQGLQWGIVAKISSDEAFAPIHTLAKYAIFWSLLVLFLVLIFSFILVRRSTASLMLIVKELAEHEAHPTQPVTRILGGHVGIIVEAYNGAVALINQLITAIREALAQTHSQLTTLNTHVAIGLKTLHTARESMSSLSDNTRTIREQHADLQLIIKQNETYIQTITDEVVQLQESDETVRKMLDKIYLDLNHALGFYADARGSMQNIEQFLLRLPAHDEQQHVAERATTTSHTIALHKEVLQKLYDQLIGVEQQVTVHAQSIPLRLERQKKLLGAVDKISVAESTRVTLQKTSDKTMSDLETAIQGINAQIEHGTQQVQDMQIVLNTLGEQETQLRALIDRIPTT
jgi:hypothetical protein